MNNQHLPQKVLTYLNATNVPTVEVEDGILYF